MPKQAYTMGIKTIMQARKVLVVANGLAKAKAVKAVSGPVTPECPGSILQLHPDCTLVADEEALEPSDDARCRDKTAPTVIIKKVRRSVSERRTLCAEGRLQCTKAAKRKPGRYDLRFYYNLL